MTTESTITQTTEMRPHFTVSPTTMLDIVGTAEICHSAALEYCCRKTGATSTEEVVAGLQAHDQGICNYYRYGLSQQVASNLGTLTDDVKAIYLFEHDATAEDICFCEQGVLSLIHLIAQVGRKTAAFDSLVEAFDQALVRSLSEQLSETARAHALDVHVVDDSDVEARKGYGAMISSWNLRPIKIWER